MEKIDKFVAAIIEADLPKNDEILQALGELWQDKTYERKLIEMADNYLRGYDLSAVFQMGFSWRRTPQGNAWWRENVRIELTERDL